MTAPRTYTEPVNIADLVIALNTTLYGKIVRKWILSDLKCRKSKRFGNLSVDFADYGVIIKFMIGLINDDITGSCAYEVVVGKIAENLKELNEMKQKAVRFKKMGNHDQHGITIREYNNIKQTLHDLINSSILLIQQVLGDIGVKHVIAGTKEFENGLLRFDKPEKEDKLKLSEIDYAKQNAEVKIILDRIESRAKNRRKH